MTTIGHSLLGRWVDVTNVSGEEGSQLCFSVAPRGVGLAQWAAATADEWASIVNQLAHLPEIAVSVAKLLTAPMS